jgi:hypothetical protein
MKRHCRCVLAIFAFLVCFANLAEPATDSYLSQYTGSYAVPEDDSFQGGVWVFKVKNRTLTGRLELSVKPMGGSAKQEMKVVKLNKNGEGEFIAKSRIYDRNGQLLQKSDKQKGKLVFKNGGVEIDGSFYKKR